MEAPLTAALQQLEILLIDCQTTGANPHRGALLELAWSRHRAGAQHEPKVHSYLVRQPQGRPLPRRIRALTGLEDDDLATARDAADVWGMLRDSTAGLAVPGSGGRAPAVAHFARFERLFLEDLHVRYGEPGPFPLELVCTHEIARRLLPGLPRRGLRAVAGYLGYVLPESKRAATHVRATIHVWSELTRMLAVQHEVNTLDELHAWLRVTRPSLRGGHDFVLDRETRLALPEAPGVYRMHARGGELLYVGKATSLKARVNSYFQKRQHPSERTAELLTQVHRVDTAVTATPLEAALRENDEIKEHAPPYNVALRTSEDAVWFATDALEDLQRASDTQHSRGPFVRPEAIRALPAIARLLGGEATDEEATGRVALALSGSAEVDPTVLAAGVEILCARHGLQSDGHRSLSPLLQLGSRLWQRQQQRIAARRNTPQTDEPTELELVAERVEHRPRTPGDADWSPDSAVSVAAAMEHALYGASHLLRRAQWIRRLADSCLLFQPRGRRSNDDARLLVMHGGRVERAEDAPPTVALPPAPGWQQPLARRAAVTDATTYDRLRVLTTEIRALAAAGHEMRLALSPDRQLSAATVQRWLYWI